MQYVSRNKRQLVINLLGFTVVLSALYLLAYWDINAFWTGFLQAITMGGATAIGLSLWAYFAYPIYSIQTTGDQTLIHNAIRPHSKYFKKLEKPSDTKWRIESDLLFGDVEIYFLPDNVVELRGPKNLLKRVRNQCGI